MHAMKNIIQRFILIFVPLLYVMAIGLLVYGYMNREGVHFTEDVGHFYLEGEYTIPSVLQPVSSLRRLHVHTALASLVFSPRHSARLLLKDGTMRNLNLQSYDVIDMEEGIFKLEFDYDVSVLLRTLPDGIAIEGMAPHKALGVKALILPFFAKTDEVITDADQVMLMVGEQQFIMQTLNKDSGVSIADKTLTIFIVDDNFDEIVFSNNLFGSIRPFSEWVAEGSDERLTDEEHALLLERYLSTSLADFSLRFNDTTELWTNTEGKFNESALMTMLVNGQKENNFRDVLELLTRAKVDSSSQLPLSTSVYLGAIDTLYNIRRTDSAARIQTFPTTVGSDDRIFPPNFANRWLMRDIFFYNSTLYPSVLTLAQRSHANDTVDILIGKMFFLLDSMRQQSSTLSVTALHEHLRKLQQSIVWLRQGLHILENDQLQFVAMVELGGLLLELAQDNLFSREAVLYKEIGYDLIASALRFIDTRGALPRFALWNNGVPRRTTDLVLVEELYPWLTQRKFYPQLTVVNIGQRHSIYSASQTPVVLTTPTANTLAFFITHPVGYTHQFMLQQPPATVIGVQVGNTTLSQVVDSLESVDQGWTYDSNSRILFVKMVQRSEREQVRVALQPPPLPSSRPSPRPSPRPEVETASVPIEPAIAPPPPVEEAPPTQGRRRR
jgi:hypothetical protein